MGWNFLIGLLWGSALEESPTYRKWTNVLVVLVLIGVLICGFIYACMMFNAVHKLELKERSKPSHVHTQRSR